MKLYVRHGVVYKPTFKKIFSGKSVVLTSIENVGMVENFNPRVHRNMDLELTHKSHPTTKKLKTHK